MIKECQILCDSATHYVWHCTILAATLPTKPLCIHSKSGKVCGVCFSVSQHLQKKCVNLNNNILRQRCVNHQISMNFVSKGHFCWGYTLFKCLNLRFKQWLNIIWGIFQFYLWKQWNLDSFCVLSQSFLRKFWIICGVWTPRSPTFSLVYSL